MNWSGAYLPRIINALLTLPPTPPPTPPPPPSMSPALAFVELDSLNIVSWMVSGRLTNEADVPGLRSVSTARGSDVGALLLVVDVVATAGGETLLVDGDCEDLAGGKFALVELTEAIVLFRFSCLTKGMLVIATGVGEWFLTGATFTPNVSRTSNVRTHAAMMTIPPKPIMTGPA